MTDVAVTVTHPDVAVTVTPTQVTATVVHTDVAVTVQPSGPAGPQGTPGTPGPGVPVGGTTNQVLAKASNTDLDTHWVDQTGGGGGGAVTSVAGRTGAVTLTTTDIGGLGSAALQASSAFDAAGAASVAQAAAVASSLQRASNLSDVANAATARTNLGLGSAATTASSAYDAAGAATAAQAAAIAASAQRASNLSDLASAATARTNLGLGSLATVTPTGTPDGTKFLRDDGSWQAAGGGVSFPLSNTAATGTTVEYSTQVTGDTNPRVTDDASGKRQWGSGAGALDTVLSRTAAGELTVATQLVAQTLKSDGTLTGVGGVGRFCGRSTGPPTAGTFAVGDFTIGAVGTVCICTAAGSPGTWVEIKRSVALGGANTPGAAVTNTVTESALLASFSASPSVMTTGVMQVWGTILNNTGSTQTARLRVKLNATFYLDTGTFSLPTSATVRPFLVQVFIYGGTSNCQMSGEIMIGGASATGTMIAPAFTFNGIGSGTDTPQGQFLNVYVTHGVASTSMTTTCTGAMVWGY